MADEPIDEARAVVEAAAAAAVRAAEAAVRAWQQHQLVNASRTEAAGELRHVEADYDSPARRAEREARVASSSATPEAKRARTISDRMNGTDPRAAATSRRVQVDPPSRSMTRTTVKEIDSGR